MNDIVDTQNQDTQKELLAAARQKYTEVKRTAKHQFYLAVCLPVFLTLLAATMKNTAIMQWAGISTYDISTWVALYCLCATFIDQIVFNRMIDNGKELAAQIQERFDTIVFSLPWNQVICGEKPSNEDVSQLLRRFKANPINKMEDLVDWYNPQIATLRKDRGILLSQRMNLYWDKSLREGANKQVIILTALWVGILVLGSLLYKLTLIDFIVAILIPVSPVVLFATKLVSDNRKSIATVSRVKGTIENSWDNASQRGVEINELRAIQDRIFDHRKTNRPISDKLYWSKKSQYEDDAGYNIEKMIQEIK